VHLARSGHPAHGHRVPAGKGAGGAARDGKEPRPAHRRSYGENIYVDDRTIDSHIKRIRKKFRTGDNDFEHIETLYGIGYRYKEH
jgi:hypothetical protein